MSMLYGSIKALLKIVTGFPKASRHLLKRQGEKLKRHGSVTLDRFGGNPEMVLSLIFLIHLVGLNCMVSFSIIVYIKY